jgi:hypothetical protein
MRRGNATLADAAFAHAGGGAHVAVRPDHHGLLVPRARGGEATLQTHAAIRSVASRPLRSGRSRCLAIAIRPHRAIIEPGRDRIASRLVVGGRALRASSGVTGLRLLCRQATLPFVVD